jgi:hypothetical protein
MKKYEPIFKSDEQLFGESPIGNIINHSQLYNAQTLTISNMFSGTNRRNISYNNYLRKRNEWSSTSTSSNSIFKTTDRSDGSRGKAGRYTHNQVTDSATSYNGSASVLSSSHREKNSEINVSSFYKRKSIPAVYSPYD